MQIGIRDLALRPSGPHPSPDAAVDVCLLCSGTDGDNADGAEEAYDPEMPTVRAGPPRNPCPLLPLVSQPRTARSAAKIHWPMRSLLSLAEGPQPVRTAWTPSVCLLGTDGDFCWRERERTRERESRAESGRGRTEKGSLKTGARKRGPIIKREESRRDISFILVRGWGSPPPMS